MKYKKILILIGSMIVLDTQCADQPHLTITNKTSNPVIINLYVNDHANAGSFGLLIQANSEQVLSLPEFYWFDKQAVGGFRKPGEPSRVKVVDVLKHALANTLDITIPNEEFYSFTLKPESLDIFIQPGKATTKVTLEKVVS